MENKKSDPTVRRSEFLREIGSLRTDLDTKTGKLALAIAQTHTDITDIKEGMNRMATKEDINKVINAIDGFAQKNETFDRKVIVHDTRINDHEVRITHLENPIIK